VKFLVAVGKLGTEFVGGAVNFSRPPPADIVDGVEHLFGGLATVKEVL
jgi:hypothetical protein